MEEKNYKDIEFEDVYAESGENINENENLQENESPEEVKKTRSEKRTLSVQEKLLKLREKLATNPPRTILGQKIAVAKLNRLSNIVDRRILKNNIINLAKQKENQEADKYWNMQDEIQHELSDLLYDRANVLSALQSLERLDPQSENSIFAEQQKRMAKNLPKGYKPKSNGKTVNSKVAIQIAQYKETLKELDRKIEEKNENLRKNDEEYQAKRMKEQQSLKKDLAVVKPNLFKRIGSFLKERKSKFNEWREQRKIKAAEELGNTLESTEGASKRGILLSNIHSGISLEEQNRIARETSEQLEEKRQIYTERDKDSKEPAND